MQIPQAQFDALARSHGERFTIHAVAWLRARQPERLEKVDDDTIRELVRHAIDRGRGWSIVAPGDLLRLLEFMLRLGPRFEEDPGCAWAHRVLAMPVDGTRKLNALLAVEREFAPRPGADPAAASHDAR